MKVIGLLLVTTVALIGCAGEQPPEADDAAMTGADRDEKGCIGSAGYVWCETTGACERPWELAEREGFDNTQEAFAVYCANQVSGE